VRQKNAWRVDSAQMEVTLLPLAPASSDKPSPLPLALIFQLRDQKQMEERVSPWVSP